MRLQQLRPRLGGAAVLTRQLTSPSPCVPPRQPCSAQTCRHTSRPKLLRRATGFAAAEPPEAAAPAPASSSSSTSSNRPLWLRWLPDAAALRLVSDAWALVYSNLWAVVLLFLAKDAAAFVLHRLAHRLTNHIAESAFGIPISSLANPWWIVVDAKFMEGHIGYQVLVGCFFLLCLPINILFNTAAVSTAAVVCSARQAAAAQAAQSSGPAASFSSHGSGKVGLAECRSNTSSVSSIDMLGSDEFMAPAAAFGTDTSSSASSAASGSSSGSRSRSTSGGAGAAVGAATFGGSGCVTFRPSSSAKRKSSSRRPGRSGSSSSSKKRAPQPAAAATPVPWVAAAAAARPSRLLLKPMGLRASAGLLVQAWRQRVAPQLQQLWEVDLRFNLWALPLQGACLAVLPVLWAFPALLGIQLSLPAAVLGGERGAAALTASRRLMAGFRKTYAWPFVWLIAAARLLELVRELVLVAIPVRWWTDVVEVPLLGTAAFAAARLLMMRVQDLVPVAAYLALTSATATSGSNSSGSNSSRSRP